ncbi:serine protease [Bacillus sp. FJAT-27225]|uniref:CAP domain-containing protein n=1 Tax=Bacillus sp. FJAT-27225 TaxID=1743144 RepID=UPI00080C20CE|nr:CAP-associated domain-containing protein [Bacillus sp. FJAT-27225]OCA90548.1 serine protease [Bacillus sp. FJAT-27225]
MSRLLMLIGLVFLINYSWPAIEGGFKNPGDMLTRVEAEASTLADNPEVRDAAEKFTDAIKQFFEQAGVLFGKITDDVRREAQPAPLEEVDLQQPEQLFSVYNIELGDSKADVEKRLGSEKRSTMNEYGLNWNAYHQDYRQFIMVMYDQDNKVAGLYTSQDLIASTNGIERGTAKDLVREKLGAPLTTIQKGGVFYRLQQDQDYDAYFKDGTYITVFYDKHEGNTVTALQLIRQDVEEKKTNLYGDASGSLKEGFEYQMFDLTNATRVNHQLPILEWDDHVRETARKHSDDMAENNYFSHTNLDGQSPFDRMEEDKLRFVLAGENLAYGQFSSIFAHEGLMNSKGHRDNILKRDYEYLGVGVAFNEQSQPYFTQNYYRN